MVTPVSPYIATLGAVPIPIPESWLFNMHSHGHSWQMRIIIMLIQIDRQIEERLCLYVRVHHIYARTKMLICTKTLPPRDSD